MSGVHWMTTQFCRHHLGLTNACLSHVRFLETFAGQTTGDEKEQPNGP